MLIKKLQKAVEPSEIPSLFKNNGIQYNKIGTCNWPEQYPYAPDAEFAIAHTGDAVLIHYRVNEKTSRAAAGEDLGRVWEDSCVEFFCAPTPGSNVYYNIECNCIGTVLVGCGDGRHDRKLAGPEVMSGIKRWATLGRKPFEEREVGTWEVALVVPAATFFQAGIKDLSGRQIRCNFYKCGDLLQTPHFLSFAPIRTENPDFHRPEFFTAADFE